MGGSGVASYVVRCTLYVVQVVETLDRAVVAAAWRDLELLLLGCGLERCSVCGGARLVGEPCILAECRARTVAEGIAVLRDLRQARAEAWDCEATGHVTELGRQGCVECERRVALRKVYVRSMADVVAASDSLSRLSYATPPAYDPAVESIDHL